MSPTPEIPRYAAFGAHSDGGNPAGIVIDASNLSDAQMLSIAAAVGYPRDSIRARLVDDIVEIA